MPLEPPVTISRIRRVVALAVVTGVVLAADLLSKAWAWHELRVEGRRKLIEGLLHFEFAFNTGSAFGILRSQAWARGAFVLITLAALLYLGRLAFTLPTRRVLPFLSIGLIAGGALGNLHDRLFRSLLVFGEGARHGVVDFIVVFYWPGKRWPAFNLADAALLLGVAGFLVHLQRMDTERKDDTATEEG